MTTTTTYRGKTGETAQYTGRYAFDGYTDVSATSAPTSEERIIPLQCGETFPPVKSSKMSAYWRYFGA